MANPPVDRFGLLPPGLHPMSLDEIAALFGHFQRTDRRPDLMRRLRTFAAEVWAAEPRLELYLDGSFVMTCVDRPEDIDAVILVPPDWDWSSTLRPFEYNVLSKRMVRKIHGFDLLVGIAGHDSGQQALEFFAQVNVKWTERFGLSADAKKGLVKVIR